MAAETRSQARQGVGVACGALRRGRRELWVIPLVPLLQRGTAAFPAPSSTGRSTGRTTTTAAAWCTSATPGSASSGCPCGSASRITAGLGRRLSVCVSMWSDSISPGDGQRTGARVKTLVPFAHPGRVRWHHTHTVRVVHERPRGSRGRELRSGRSSSAAILAASLLPSASLNSTFLWCFSYAEF